LEVDNWTPPAPAPPPLQLKRKITALERIVKSKLREMLFIEFPNQSNKDENEKENTKQTQIGSMKYFLIHINYIVPIDKVIEVTPEHRVYLKTQYDAGRLLFSGPRVPRTAGVLFARAADISQIDDMIAADPFKTQGIGDYEVIEISPAMWAQELNKIFG